MVIKKGKIKIDGDAQEVLRMYKDISKASKETEKTVKSSGKKMEKDFDGSMKKMKSSTSKVMNGINAIIGATMVSAVAKEVMASERRQLSLKILEKRNIGYANAVRSADQNTLGLVSSMDTLDAAQKALSYNLGLSAKEFQELQKASVKAALVMGKDPVEATERVIDGIGKLSIMRLDDLGVTGQLNEIYGEYAKANNLVATTLTNAEKKAALYIHTMKDLRATGKEATDEMIKDTTRITQSVKLGQKVWNDMIDLATAGLGELARFGSWIGEATADTLHDLDRTEKAMKRIADKYIKMKKEKGEDWILVDGNKLVKESVALKIKIDEGTEGLRDFYTKLDRLQEDTSFFINIGKLQKEEDSLMTAEKAARKLLSDFYADAKTMRLDAGSLFTDAGGELDEGSDTIGIGLRSSEDVQAKIDAFRKKTAKSRKLRLEKEKRENEQYWKEKNRLALQYVKIGAKKMTDFEDGQAYLAYTKTLSEKARTLAKDKTFNSSKLKDMIISKKARVAISEKLQKEELEAEKKAEEEKLQMLQDFEVQKQDFDNSVWELKQKNDKQRKDIELAQLEDRLRTKAYLEQRYQTASETAARISSTVITDISTELYSKLVENSDATLKEIAMSAFRQAGSQIYADGVQRMWKGAGDALDFAHPVIQAAGLEQMGYGALEIGAGIAMGKIGSADLPSSSSSSKSESKESAAADTARNNKQDNYESGVVVYLHKSERDYLNNLGKSVRKTSTNRIGSRT